MKIWRLTTRATSDEAFDGIGASKNPGRWNKDGEFVAYMGESISLCILENLVHFDVSTVPALYLYSIEIDPDHFSQQDDLTIVNSPSKAREYGSKWYKSKTSMCLRAPSKVVNEEYIFVLNITHPKFQNLEIVSHGLFDLDSRLTQK